MPPAFTVLLCSHVLFTCSEPDPFLQHLQDSSKHTGCAEIRPQLKTLRDVSQKSACVRPCCLQYSMCFFPFCTLCFWITGIVAPQTSTCSHVFAEDCQVSAAHLAVIDKLCCNEICCAERLHGAASLKHPERRENV